MSDTYIVNGQPFTALGSAVMQRNYLLGKTGVEAPIETVIQAPTPEQLARQAAIASLPPNPSLQDFADAGLLGHQAPKVDERDTITTEQFADSVQQVIAAEPLGRAALDSGRLMIVPVGLPAPRRTEVVDPEPVPPSDDVDSLNITALRKLASSLGLKGAYKGPKREELVAFIKANQ